MQRLLPLLLLAPLLLGGDSRVPLPLMASGRSSTPAAAYSVVHIMDDDATVFYREEACAGDCAANMPTFDRLKDEGITFTQMLQPNGCATNRASVLTGMQSFQHGVLGGQAGDYTTTNSELPLIMRLTGVSTISAMFGKLGLGTDYRNVGLERFWGYAMSPVPLGDWFDYSMIQATYPAITASVPTGPTDYLGTDVYEEAAAWITALPAGQKYVLYMWTPFAHSLSFHDPPGSIPPASCIGAGDPWDCCTGPGAGATCVDTDDDCDAGVDNCRSAEFRYGDLQLDAVVDAALAHGDVLFIYEGESTGDSVQEVIFSFGDIPVLDRGTTRTEPIQVPDIAVTMYDYLAIDQAAFNYIYALEDLRGYSLRPLITDGGSCTGIAQVAGGCWDGTDDRCVYAADDGVGTLVRSIRCTTPATDGYVYKLNGDGTNPRIYSVLDEITECVDAPCLAAEAELEVTLPAYDGLPGP